MPRALPFLLAAVLVIGLTQSGGEDPQAADQGPSTAAMRDALRGAHEPLAALYRRDGAIERATVGEYEEQIRALRGFPVVVNAWASWCGPCKLERHTGA